MLSKQAIFMVVVGVVLGCVVAKQLLTSSRRAIHYKHSLEYPKYQHKELAQVGFLDRG